MIIKLFITAALLRHVLSSFAHLTLFTEIDHEEYLTWDNNGIVTIVRSWNGTVSFHLLAKNNGRRQFSCNLNLDASFYTGFSQYINPVNCEDIAPWIRKNAASLDTGGTCITACTDLSCSGTCLDFLPGSLGHDDLSIVELENKLTSVKPCGFDGSKSARAPRKIQVVNKCAEDIWIATAVFSSSKSTDFPEEVVKLKTNTSHQFNIPNKEGWSGRMWPKMECDGKGQSCKTGQSIPPCPAEGCQPSANTYVEYYFPSTESSHNAWYDVSILDGYSLPVTVTPSQQDDTCVKTACQVSFADCPGNELYVGNLTSNGTARMCLSPCSKWKEPAPYGFGKKENLGVGLHYCCPTPPMTPDACRKAIVESKYLELVQNSCPSAYSFSYDQSALHNCPTYTNFLVTFCG